MRIVDFFDKSASKHAHEICLIDDQGRRTWSQVQATSHRLAHALLAHGIRPESKVAILAPNSARVIECILGLLRANCVWVPIDSNSSPEEITLLLNRTDADVLLFSSGLGPRAEHVRRQFGDEFKVLSIDGPVGGFPDLDSSTSAVPDTPVDLPWLPTDVVAMPSTGGTTGAPKAVVQRHLNFFTWVALAKIMFSVPNPVNLVAAPITHAAGAGALINMAIGATTVILAKFEAEPVMAAIQEHKVTHMFLPPTAIYRMLDHPKVRDYDYSSLRYLQYAAAPMAPQRIKQAMDVFGPCMNQAYGGTEMGVNVCYFSPEEHQEARASGNERRFLSCGRPTLFSRVEVMDEQGHLLPPGEAGEIVVQTNGLMREYYRNPEETERALAFGWYHTGDIGKKDEEGWVYLEDRKRDVIISGGFNVFPSEVENVIRCHPAVRECAVIGVPDAYWGEAVTAVIVLEPGTTLDVEEVRALCREKLGAYKVPKAFHTWSDLPRDGLGKLLRRAVRAKFWEGHERKI
jgi:acyl-CoA synthetase (AMP-forming)/AMP-acid ligase II